MKKLYKIKEKGKFAGVCAGIADLTKIDVTFIRIITFILCCFHITGLIIYILLAWLLPEKNNI